jgi:hypothetical protein
MPDMAKKADTGLAEICGSSYLEPTFHSHATAYGIGTWLRETEGGAYTFNESTEPDAQESRASRTQSNSTLAWLAE